MNVIPEGLWVLPATADPNIVVVVRCEHIEGKQVLTVRTSTGETYTAIVGIVE